MKITATRNLPTEYVLARRLDIRETRNLLIINLWGVLLLILSWIGFTRLAIWIRPESTHALFSFSINNLAGILLDLGMLLLVTVVMLVVHEGLHGIFFWIFTKTVPKFAFKGYYAYAAAPDWYLPKGQYLVTGLAPLVGITLICVILMFFVPLILIPPLVWMLVLNTSGAVGDLWMVWRLLRSPANVLAMDKGDVLEFYTPNETE
jgi:hypothetical protein